MEALFVPAIARVPGGGLWSIGLGRLWLYLLVAASGHIGCVATLPPPHAALAVRPECPPASSDAYFFPPGSLIPDEPGDQKQRELVSLFLKSATEPSLSCGPEPVEGYRVTLFQGPVGTVVASVLRIDANWRYTATRFAPPTDGRLDVIEERQTGPVDGGAVGGIPRLLDSAQFWTTRVFVHAVEAEGRMWLVEARQGPRYRAISRVTPDPAMHEVARFIAGIAGIQLPGIPVGR